MAFSTSGVLSTVVERYQSGLAAVDDSWSLTVKRRTDAAHAIRLAGMHVVGEMASWNGTADLSSDAKEIDEYNTTNITLTATQYAVQLKVDRLSAQNVPEALPYAAERVGFAVANTYAKQCFAAWAAGFSSTKSGDNKALFASDHTTKAGTSRSNLLTSALDSSSLMAAIKLARSWQSYDNSPYDLVSAGFYLIIPPALEEAAHQAIRSAFVLNQAVEAGSASGVFKPPATQGLSNVAGNFYSPVDIIVNSHASDDNDWMIVSKLESPFTFFDRLRPELRRTVDPDTLLEKITVDAAFGFGVGAEPSYAFGSNVS